MSPDLLLSIAAGVAGFALKSTAAFLVCLVLNRLAQSPNQRFILWSGFIYGAAFYWLYLATVLLSGRSAPFVGGSYRGPSLSANAWMVPTSWAWPGELAVGAAGVVYLVFLGYCVFSYIKKRLHLHWVLSFSQAPPVEVSQAFTELARELRVSRSRLLILSGATSPATFGWIHPTVLLPSFCLDQAGPELDDILRHELQHVRRWDSAWNGLATACRALLGFHPAIWYGVHRMQFERELACDLAVVAQSPARREHYAACLLRFARLNLVHEPNNWGIDFAASAQHLTVRVHTILAGSKRVPRWLVGLRSVSGLALFAFLIGLLPSLAVLLSFVPPTNMPSPTQAAQHAGTVGKQTTTKSKRGHSQFLASASQKQHAAAEDPGNTAQPTYTLPAIEQTSPVQPSGPRLLQRPSGSSSLTGKAQSVMLTDQDVAGKDGGLDRKQAVQQTATAALGMYRRVAELDRR